MKKCDLRIEEKRPLQNTLQICNNLANDEAIMRLQKHMMYLRHKVGAGYIIHLLQNPDREIPYFYFEHCETTYDELNKIWCPSLDINFEIIKVLANKFDFMPIPMCDEQTKCEVKRSLNIVIEKIALAKQMNLKIELFDLYKERDELQNYLMEVLRENGKIRFFKDLITRSKYHVTRNIKRFFDELEMTDEELARLIKNNVIFKKFHIKYSHL